MTSQPEFILHDGKFLPAGSMLVSADNRCFRYGDGLFETMRLENNLIELWALHMDRLYHGLELLHFTSPLWDTREQLFQHILHLVKLNQHQHAARIRLQVYRGDGGLNDGNDPFSNYVVQSTPFPNKSMVNDNRLIAGIHPHIRKSCDIYAQTKSCNFLPYSQAAGHARDRGWDECLVLNQYERICDASAANIFWVRNKEIFTPPLSEGPVAGVMRRHLLRQLNFKGFQVQEAIFDTTMLDDADELFLTNAVHGIRSIHQIGEKSYGSALTKEIVQILSHQ